MGTSILKMPISLGGFVGRPNDEMEWVPRTSDPEAIQWVVNTRWSADARLMGSRSYRDMLAY